MAEALYRKYRPQVFGDMVGQEHIERTLRNAIDGNRVSHAYLFTGPRGTGKTTTARLLAKALMCQDGPTSNPCSTCEDCQLIAQGVHPDVYELDAASRTGVDNVREEIIGRVQYAPTRGRSKIYIVDEVHMLSTAAFNALLKTLEEPPAHVVFILCTTDPQKVPETIRSRCQRFDFRRISPENIVSRLGAVCVAEGVRFEGEALDLIAQRADGGMRDALTSLEQLIVYGEGAVTLAEAERLLGSLDVDEMAEIVEAIGRRDTAAAFRWTAHYMETGADLAQFVQDLAERIRNLYVFAILGSDACVAVGEVERRHIARELPLFGPDRLAYILGVLGDVQKELKTSANMRLSFEIALTRMVRPATDLTLEALAARIEALEAARYAVGVAVPLGGECAPRGMVPAGEEAASGSAGPARGGECAPSIAGPADDGGHCEACSTAMRAVDPTDANPVPVPSAESVREEPLRSEPASASALPAQLANNAALQRAWQQVMTIVKKEKTAYGVLFLNTKARSEAGKLIIEFAAESDFAFKAVQKPDVDEVLARAIRQVFSADVPYSFNQAASVPAEASVPASYSASPAAASVAAAQEPPCTSEPVAVAPHEAAPRAAAPAMQEEVPAAWDEMPAATCAAADEPYAGAAAVVDDEPPFDPWVPEEEEEAYWPPSADDQEQAQAASASQPAMVAEATGGQVDSADLGMSELQDALSLFGTVKIEEID